MPNQVQEDDSLSKIVFTRRHHETIYSVVSWVAIYSELKYPLCNDFFKNAVTQHLAFVDKIWQIPLANSLFLKNRYHSWTANSLDYNMYLIFDTETTGLPRNYNAPITDTDNWPRCIQIAWQLHDEMGRMVEHQDYLVKPEGFNIPYDAERIHGISTELAEEQGVTLAEVLEKFNAVLAKSKFIVGQNVGFDVNIMGC